MVFLSCPDASSQRPWFIIDFLYCRWGLSLYFHLNNFNSTLIPVNAFFDRFLTFFHECQWTNNSLSFVSFYRGFTGSSCVIHEWVFTIETNLIILISAERKLLKLIDLSNENFCLAFISFLLDIFNFERNFPRNAQNPQMKYIMIWTQHKKSFRGLNQKSKTEVL